MLSFNFLTCNKLYANMFFIIFDANQFESYIFANNIEKRKHV